MSEQILDSQSTASDYRAAGAPAGAPADPGASGGAKAPRRTRSSRRFLLVGGSVIAGLLLGGAWLMMQPAADPLDDATAISANGTAGAGPAAGSSEPSGAAQGAGDDGAKVDGAEADGAAGPKADGAKAATDKGTASAAGTDAADAQPQAGDEVAKAPKRAKITSRDPFAPIVAKPAATSAKSQAKAAKESKAAKKPVEAPAAVPQVASGATISALRVTPSGDSVTLKLDGKKYTVEEGETFAKSYRLYDIFNANCAGFLYGDQNAVVCEGDSVKIG
ncbi:MAG: hypothetical protein WCF36_12150 [Candidatus Nanopelagicales bacterium]